MRAASSLVCAVPPECFGDRMLQDFHQETLRRFISQIRTAERRLGKGVAPDEQAERINRLVRSAEDTVLER